MAVKLLKVDLSKRFHSIDRIPEKNPPIYWRQGLRSLPLIPIDAAGNWPLREGNHLVFIAGPANGTNLIFLSKALLATRSPLTRIYLHFTGSGSFAHCSATLQAMPGIFRDHLDRSINWNVQARNPRHKLLRHQENDQ
jgi:aldehyde:ferredoxin oxidoreductase